jgi:hypothetical protein
VLLVDAPVPVELVVCVVEPVALVVEPPPKPVGSQLAICEVGSKVHV